MAVTAMAGQQLKQAVALTATTTGPMKATAMTAMATDPKKRATCSVNDV